ncbi:MAG: hypothetical protein RMJ87_08810 [Cytophagales bacterium]|nr:hypothetical protein [Bernardetiaceae bacterium]MDW8205113.1 hypothetical protein [Cytophagales bacterium]
MTKSAKILSILIAAGFFFIQPALHALDRVEVSKKITEKYDMHPQDMLDVSNKYGTIHIHTWEKSEVMVEVTVRAWSNNERRAKEALDRIQIKYGKTGSVVQFETQINSSANVSINVNSGFEINYLVYMPISNSLKLSNRYGGVFIDNFNGSLDAFVRYGNLKTNKMTGGDKKIDIAYGNADIEQLENGIFEIAYGNGIIREASKLTVRNRYSKMEYENVKELHTETKYGGILIENEVETITGNIAYSDFRAHRLKKQAQIEARYAGNFSIDEVSKGFEQIILDGTYSSFTVYFGSKHHFEFSLSASYGSIRIDVGEAEIRREVSQSHTQILEGQVGKAGGKVRITTKYGSIRLK